MESQSLALLAISQGETWLGPDANYSRENEVVRVKNLPLEVSEWESRPYLTSLWAVGNNTVVLGAQVPALERIVQVGREGIVSVMAETLSCRKEWRWQANHDTRRVWYVCSHEDGRLNTRGGSTVCYRGESIALFQGTTSPVRPTSRFPKSLDQEFLHYISL